MANKPQPTNQDLYEILMDLRKELDETYLRIKIYEAEVGPLKRLLYGFVAIAGAAFVTSLMRLILR
jgi:hypothetical protein